MEIHLLLKIKHDIIFYLVLKTLIYYFLIDRLKDNIDKVEQNNWLLFYRKCCHKRLVLACILWPVVNFNIILQAAFCLDFLLPKISQMQTVSIQKLCKTLSFEKVACKMLVKLTPGCCSMNHYISFIFLPKNFESVYFLSEQKTPSHKTNTQKLEVSYQLKDCTAKMSFDE